jgi:hypothetical protein
MIPLVQAAGPLGDGGLVELHPSARVSVDLYWHRWTLAPAWLEELTAELVRAAPPLLAGRGI